MEVKNCRGCRRLFNYLGGPQLCPACIDKQEKKFQQVKKYLDENPKATINDISKDNEVSRRQIEQWVREDRLYFSEDSPYGIECENCGKMIKSGRFCNECRGKMANKFQSVLKKPDTQKGNTGFSFDDHNRMRYLDK